jgi:hypothetical protein
LIDLPKLSVIVTGLDDWPSDTTYSKPIVEDRSLAAVLFALPDVWQLRPPPVVPDTGLPPDPFDSSTSSLPRRRSALAIGHPVRLLWQASPFMAIVFTLLAIAGIVVQIRANRRFEIESYNRFAESM